MAAWTLVGAIGLLGLTTLGIGLVVLLVTATVIGGAIGCAMAIHDPGRQALGDTVCCGLFGCASVLVGAGLTVLVGPMGVVIVLVGVALAGRRYWNRSPDDDRADAAPLADIRGWSDAELGREWSRSHRRLSEARDVTALTRVWELRRRQLDEMERRDPVGFRRWADGGAWITGNTAPFLGT